MEGLYFYVNRRRNITTKYIFSLKQAVMPPIASEIGGISAISQWRFLFKASATLFYLIHFNERVRQNKHGHKLKFI